MRLLVSVRSVQEAQAALAGGADLLDVKEPRRGPLGCADPYTLHEVVVAVGEAAPLSAALGELRAPPGSDTIAALRGYKFAKLGLAGAASIENWPAKWERWVAALPEGVAPVAVIYADWKSCGSPPPNEIVAHARRIRCRALLIDTFRKNGQSLLQLLPPDAIGRTLKVARQSGMTTVVAGSLQLSDLSGVAAVAPDYLAVRGAVCSANRSSAINPLLVREFSHQLALLRARENTVAR